jgi:hypothetical protein
MTGWRPRHEQATSAASPCAGALVSRWWPGSVQLAPQGANQFQLLINKQDAMTEFDTLVPGRFSSA